MKILVMSDTHLSDFDEDKFRFLEELISSVDKVIINGDFWDCWYVTFDDFLNSKWNQLFDLLLSKETVYLHGNHDPKEVCDERVKRFSLKDSNTYEFIVGDKSYRCEHGHRLLKRFDKRKIVEFYNRILSNNPKLVYFIFRKAGRLGWKLSLFVGGSGVAKKMNAILKDKGDSRFVNIFGHTHLAEVDRKRRFVNTGSINYGEASYVIINEEGDLELKRTSY